jgi:hypothetical protein
MNFAAADEMRRWYGSALDLWFARTGTPSRLVLEKSRVKLRDYGDDGNRPFSSSKLSLSKIGT